jgi:MoaA/NifB/PqqE/SkfB family radical SAM enzyme
MINFTEIKKVQTEFTTRCQASCPGCRRNYNGYRPVEWLPSHEMTLRDFEKIFPENFLRQLEELHIVGNFGENAIARDCIEIIEHALRVNPQLKLVMATNGSVRNEEWWRRLGERTRGKLNTLFCLDGLEDTHSIYRQGTQWKKVIANAKAYLEGGGHATWKMIPFRHNEHQIFDCQKLSKELGFQEFILADQGRDQMMAFTPQGKPFTVEPVQAKGLQHPEQPLSITADEWVDTVKRYREMEARSGKILNPALARTNACWRSDRTLQCQTQLEYSIYVSANGEVYPCCYIGEYPRIKQTLASLQMKDILADFNNNALEVGIEAAVQWFDRVARRWEKESFENGMVLYCLMCCHRTSARNLSRSKRPSE